MIDNGQMITAIRSINLNFPVVTEKDGADVIHKVFTDGFDCGLLITYTCHENGSVTIADESTSASITITDDVINNLWSIEDFENDYYDRLAENK